MPGTAGMNILAGIPLLFSGEVAQAYAVAPLGWQHRPERNPMNAPYKTVSLDEMKARLSPEDRVLAEQQAAELIAEERTLRDLRKAIGQKQLGA